MKKLIILLILPLQLFAQFSKEEINRYQQTAQQVTISRDNWGIPHIYGKTDANAVFGLLYAQCEDDFKRVELNYIEKLGRLAEVNGEKDLYNDLLIKMIIDTADAKKDYDSAPDWLKKLCNAFADGINYYLYKHPATKPALLQHFEPWYPFLWTDGSIGAISTAGLTERDLKNLYGSELTARHSERSEESLAKNNFKKSGDFSVASLLRNEDEKLTGSNGFAFAPSITENHHAILYINPHVTFYFRPEVHVVSEEGLNVYGAVTWGQFFVYQGFNEHCGWMHTSSQVDVSDAYIEKLSQQNNKWKYEYEHQQKDVIVKTITISFKQKNTIQNKTFKTLYTHHGPIMAKKNGQWLSVQSFNRSTISLQQSWLRTKAISFDAFKKVLYMKANTSNNTVYADAEGNIGYWHGNFVPIRNKKYDWSKPVDGTIAATDWQGLHMVDDIVHCINPANGWLQNCNSSPFTVAGNNSPKKENYPRYMAPDGENFRGINAVSVLSKEKNYTIDKVIAAGYNTNLAFFETTVPALIKAYNTADDSIKTFLKAPIAIMQAWDFHAGENSVATTIGVFWGTQLLHAINNNAVGGFVDFDEFDDQVTKTNKFIAKAANAKLLLNTFATAIKNLQQQYGSWNIPWGSINRFQRINDEVDGQFDDAAPSIPVGFTSSQWGQLCSYTSRIYPNTKKLYGVNGNSFICAVEFGKTIKAKSLLAGGESGDIHSKHFADQATMYSKGIFKDVLFYKDDVLKHAEKTYHPGE
jgi:acyl-homoserine lactone acylase PvdQ